MDRIAVSTVVYLPPEEVFEFLVDFPRYARYSEHLRDVTRDGDGSAGTRYDLTFAWWKLTYTVRSEVTAVERPERVEWRIVSRLNATGRWRVDPLGDLPADAPADADAASRVWFEVRFDPGSAGEDAVDLPRLVSLDWVLGKVKPLAVAEAERVVERVVADLEGRRRDVDLTVHERPG
ncbi:MAG: SRPBCC family protein [Haloferacaceae archaeon]